MGNETQHISWSVLHFLSSNVYRSGEQRVSHGRVPYALSVIYMRLSQRSTSLSHAPFTQLSKVVITACSETDLFPSHGSSTTQINDALQLFYTKFLTMIHHSDHSSRSRQHNRMLQRGPLLTSSILRTRDHNPLDATDAWEGQSLDRPVDGLTHTFGSGIYRPCLPAQILILNQQMSPLHLFNTESLHDEHDV